MSASLNPSEAPSTGGRISVSRRAVGLMFLWLLGSIALLGCMAHGAVDSSSNSTGSTSNETRRAIESMRVVTHSPQATAAEAHAAAVAAVDVPETPRLELPEIEVPPAMIEVGNPANWHLEIPSIGVGAPMIPLGLDRTGTMEVPNDGVTVGWYQFTAAPGNPGNAVVAAHVDYRGAAGVFQRLSTLAAGDRVSMHVEGQVVTYVVDSVTLVRPELADVAAIIGDREGASTLTLITCGGSWDRERRDYDHRVIVTASLASPGTAS